MSDDIVPWLFGFTLLAFLVIGLVQWRSARRARENHERSAMTPPDPPRQDADAPARRS